MSQRLIELGVQRERLIGQAAAQRMALARNIEPWRIPLTLAGYGLAALRFVRSHPVWIVGGMLFSALRLGRMVKWARHS